MRHDLFRGMPCGGGCAGQTRRVVPCGHVLADLVSSSPKSYSNTQFSGLRPAWSEPHGEPEGSPLSSSRLRRLCNQDHHRNTGTGEVTIKRAVPLLGKSGRISRLLAPLGRTATSRPRSNGGFITTRSTLLVCWCNVAHSRKSACTTWCPLAASTMQCKPDTSTQVVRSLGSRFARPPVPACGSRIACPSSMSASSTTFRASRSGVVLARMEY